MRTVRSIFFSSLGAGMTFASLNLGSLLTAKSFPWLLHSLQLFGTFYFYTAVNVLIFLVGWANIKKSDGLSLVKAEEVYEYINDSKIKKLVGKEKAQQQQC